MGGEGANPMQSEVVRLSPYFTKLEVPHKAKRLKADLRRVIVAIESENRRNAEGVLGSEFGALCQYGVVMGLSVFDDGCRWTLSLETLRNMAGDEYVQALDQLALVLIAIQESLGYQTVQIDEEGVDGTFFAVLLLAHCARFAQRYGVPADLLDDVSAIDAAAWLRSLQLGSSQQLRVDEAIELVERHGVRFVIALPKLETTNTSNIVDVKTTVMAKKTEVDMHVEDAKFAIWYHVHTHDGSTWRWYVEQDQDGHPSYISCAAEGTSEKQRAVLGAYVVLCNDLLSAGEINVLPRIGSSLDMHYFTEKLVNGPGPVSDFALAFAHQFIPDIAAALAKDSSEGQVLLDIADEVTRRCEICASDRVETFGSYGICLNCGGAQSIA